jgi:hypothetical protein
MFAPDASEDRSDMTVLAVEPRSSPRNWHGSVANLDPPSAPSSFALPRANSIGRRDDADGD